MQQEQSLCLFTSSLCACLPAQTKRDHGDYSDGEDQSAMMAAKKMDVRCARAAVLFLPRVVERVLWVPEPASVSYWTLPWQPRLSCCLIPA